jgi:EAL domain-containing protein (putative c-di-GMP-specific phosphodiesterase class I)
MTGAGIMFTVNISMENITDEDFLPFLEELMNTYPASREHCILEITESEGVENYDDVRAFIESAHSQGYKIAIDDFGSGYSNFANIIRLPIDYIKFDGALIQQMNSDPRAVTVLSKMNEIAQALKIRTVAEFVDSRELHTIVKRCKIDYAQGFLLGKPSSRLAKRATQMET